MIFLAVIGARHLRFLPIFPSSKKSLQDFLNVWGGGDYQKGDIMTQEEIERLHDSGNMPDWVYYQVNGKSAEENYREIHNKRNLEFRRQQLELWRNREKKRKEEADQQKEMEKMINEMLDKKLEKSLDDLLKGLNLKLNVKL